MELCKNLQYIPKLSKLYLNSIILFIKENNIKTAGMDLLSSNLKYITNLLELNVNSMLIDKIR